MAKKREEKREIKRDKKRQRQDNKALSRRDFFSGGAAAGVGAAVLSTARWRRRRRARHSVELRGRCRHPRLGMRRAACRRAGARPRRLRARHRSELRRRRQARAQRRLDVARRRRRHPGTGPDGGRPAGPGADRPLIKAEDLEDDPDRLFRDMTDWSVVDATGVARYRYNDRELHRAWADNAPKARQFMMDNYVRFARIDGTHQGGGMSRARAARAMMKMADKTDIKAGTLSPQDRGDPRGERHSPFNPMRLRPGRRRPSRARRAGVGVGRFRHREVPGVQRAGEGRPVHAQPPHGRDSSASSRSRAGFSGSKPATRRACIPKPARGWKASGRTATSTSAPRRSTSARARPSSSPPAACMAASRCGP